jgi:hypothetical protein
MWPEWMGSECLELVADKSVVPDKSVVLVVAVVTVGAVVAAVAAVAVVAVVVVVVVIVRALPVPLLTAVHAVAALDVLIDFLWCDERGPLEMAGNVTDVAVSVGVRQAGARHCSHLRGSVGDHGYWNRGGGWRSRGLVRVTDDTLFSSSGGRMPNDGRRADALDTDRPDPT